MAEVTYRVVQHDDGWAYAVGDVFSERFPTRELARAAAEAAAARQRLAGSGGTIEYEDREGRWHHEITAGSDRPETTVEEAPAPREAK